MKVILISGLLALAVLVAGCASTDESNDNATTSTGGNQVSGDMVVGDGGNASTNATATPTPSPTTSG